MTTTSTQTPRKYFDYTVAAGPIPGVRTHHGVFAPPKPGVPGAVEFIDLVRATTTEPFKGITADGNVIADVYSHAPSGIDNSAVVEAANAFLDAIDQPDMRLYVQQPVDHWQRRAWFNGSPLWMPEGIILEDLRPEQREAAMEMVHQALGETGYKMVRDAMLVTENVGNVWNTYTDTLRQWSMWITVWGEPNNEGRPWGFQINALHIVINALYVGDRLVLEPLFFGAELKIIDRGPHEGLQLFQEEEERGMALGRSLTDEQRAKAVVYPSILSADLPPERAGAIDGRQVAGAGRDNEVIPYEGLTVADLTEEQRGLLIDLIDIYLARLPDGHRELRREEIMRYFDDQTYISWIGDPAEMPFYYRIQSPSVIIEFDHHPGLGFLPPFEAIPEHVHTIMRMPNGGDYGFELLSRVDG